MNIGDMINALAAKHDLTKALSRDIVTTFIETIQEKVKKGDKVSLTGFGVFERVDRKGRTGRNPQTGEKVKIPPKKVPSFRPGKPFKLLVEPVKKKRARPVKKKGTKKKRK